MCVWVSVGVNICVFVGMRYVGVRMFVRVHVCDYVCAYVRQWVSIFRCVSMCYVGVGMYVHMYVWMYVCAHIGVVVDCYSL